MFKKYHLDLNQLSHDFGFNMLVLARVHHPQPVVHSSWVNWFLLNPADLTIRQQQSLFDIPGNICWLVQVLLDPYFMAYGIIQTSE